MRSSYEENNYGSVLESLIVGLKPMDCVEVGVLDGYSALHIARGLKFNKEAFGIDGKLWCWDLWDDYVYNHGNQYEVQKLIDDNELSGFVKLNNGEAFETAHLIQYESVDFLHMDISNDGATLKKVMQFWSHRIKPCGMIAFEGICRMEFQMNNIRRLGHFTALAIFVSLTGCQVPNVEPFAEEPIPFGRTADA